jgi:hypothetical protein
MRVRLCGIHGMLLQQRSWHYSTRVCDPLWRRLKRRLRRCRAAAGELRARAYQVVGHRRGAAAGVLLLLRVARVAGAGLLRGCAAAGAARAAAAAAKAPAHEHVDQAQLQVAVRDGRARPGRATAPIRLVNTLA